MEIRIRETGQVVSEYEFISMHAKHISFSLPLTLDQLDGLGADPVMEGARPAAGPYQDVVRDGVEQNGFGWFTKYVLRDWSPEEIEAHRASAKTAQWEAIKIERERRLLLGGFPVGDHWFHSDLVSRSQFLSNARRADRVEAGGGDMNAIFLNKEGTTIAVKTMDNGYVPITATLAHEIMEAAELQESKTYVAAIVHKDSMEALDNPATYEYIQDVAKTRWPPIFGE